MRVHVNSPDRTPQFIAQVDLAEQPAKIVGPDEQPVDMQWDGAVSDNHTLIKCPVCGCRELFVRKAFPQKVGLAFTVMAGIAAFVLFTQSRALLAFAVLGGMAVVDGLVYLITPRCIVCYRCRSEFHGTPIDPSLEPWELATGEKYRQA